MLRAAKGLILLSLKSPLQPTSSQNKLKSWRKKWKSLKQCGHFKDNFLTAIDPKQTTFALDFKAACRRNWLAAAATLLWIIVSPAPAQAWPEKILVSHQEDENGKYTIVDLKKQNCKINGSLDEGLKLYRCFAYLYDSANIISLTYLIESNYAQTKERIQCSLSDNPNQTMIFHPRYKDNQPRKSLVTTVKNRTFQQDSNGRYSASITVDGWWLKSNRFVDMGLKDVRADDICGLTFYFKPAKKLVRVIKDLSR